MDEPAEEVEEKSNHPKRNENNDYGFDQAQHVFHTYIVAEY
jgi:hypothetical protein